MKTREFELAEENPAVFGLFVHHLYHEDDMIDFDKESDDAEIFLIEAYLLGERRDAPAFTNAVLDALRTFWGDSQTLPSPDSITLCYNESPSQPPIRRFIVDKWVYEGDVDDLDESVEAVHPEFAFDFFKATLNLRSRPGSASPYVNQFCKAYHVPVDCDHRAGCKCDKTEAAGKHTSDTTSVSGPPPVASFGLPQSNSVFGGSSVGNSIFGTRTRNGFCKCFEMQS